MKRLADLVLAGPRFLRTWIQAANQRMLIRSAEADLVHMKADLAALPQKIAEHERAIGARRVSLALIEKPLNRPPLPNPESICDRTRCA